MTLLLDTTVLSYATGGGDHPLAGPARAVIRSAIMHPGSATTTPEVLQEYLHVRAHRRGRPEAARRVNDFAGLLSPLVLVEEVDLRLATDLFVEHDHIGAFDSVLAAVALRHDELELVSADRGFASIAELAFRRLDEGDW